MCLISYALHILHSRRNERMFLFQFLLFRQHLEVYLHRILYLLDTMNLRVSVRLLEQDCNEVVVREALTDTILTLRPSMSSMHELVIQILPQYFRGIHSFFILLTIFIFLSCKINKYMNHLNCWTLC